jgi:hypothetical protein
MQLPPSWQRWGRRLLDNPKGKTRANVPEDIRRSIKIRLAAGGDLMVLWLIRGVRRGQFVQDHPTQVGCYLIEMQDL